MPGYLGLCIVSVVISKRSSTLLSKKSWEEWFSNGHRSKVGSYLIHLNFRWKESLIEFFWILFQVGFIFLGLFPVAFYRAFYDSQQQSLGSGLIGWKMIQYLTTKKACLTNILKIRMMVLISDWSNLFSFQNDSPWRSWACFSMPSYMIPAITKASPHSARAICTQEPWRDQENDTTLFGCLHQ